jgi:hypothetical protein
LERNGDDTLVFCGANPNQIRYIGALLICFETISGLKVNLAKSISVLIGTLDNVGDVASILGCGVASLPLKYLGLPLGASFKAKAIWDDMLEKYAHRLAPWKRMYLSIGGRVTLIKSTLFNIPIYFLSQFPIPTTVDNRIEKLQRDFVCGGINDEFQVPPSQLAQGLFSNL